jgi:hypothetical protein
VVTWIVVAVLVLALVLLALAVRAPLRRLRGLRDAGRALAARRAQAQALQEKVAALNERLARVADQAPGQRKEP